MGIFDFLKKSGTKQGTAVVSESEELRKELFDLILKNNLTEFELAAARNEDMVIRSFPDWRRIPHDVSVDHQKSQQYSHCLVVIASYFQRERRRNEPMALLTGIDGSEVISQWKENLGKAQELIKECQYDEALSLLEECHERADKLTGPAAENLKPITLGYLAEAYFQTGEWEKAVPLMQKAREAASNVGDFDAEIAYLRNLYEVHRYAGLNRQAAEYALTMSSKFYKRENLVLASNWKHQAKAVEAGEPPIRVLVKMGEEFFDVDEIPKVDSGKVEYIMLRNKVELRPSMFLCDQGREMAESGKVEDALPLFQAAIEKDKYNPVPHYFSAAIYMHQQQYDKALEHYDKTEELCPGWEGCRPERWLAAKLHEGKYEHDAFGAMMQVMNDDVPEQERMEICQKFIEKYPDFGELYYQLGRIIAHQKNRPEAIAAFKKGLEVAADPDVRSRLLRDLALVTEDQNEKLDSLASAASLPGGNIVASAMCKYILRQMKDD